MVANHSLSGNSSLSQSVAFRLIVAIQTLLGIPVEEADLDAGSGKALLEDFQVRAPVVIGDDDLRVEGPDRVGSFLGRHGVGKVHADEGDVDVLEGAHLRDAFGVSGEVEALASVGEDVTIVASLGMVELSGGGTARKVVGGDGFDYPLLPLPGLTVGDGFGGGKLFDDRGGSEYLRGGLAEGRDGFGIEVIGVNVGDQDEVGFGESGELCGLGRIDVNGFASGLNEMLAW